MSRWSSSRTQPLSRDEAEDVGADVAGRRRRRARTRARASSVGSSATFFTPGRLPSASSTSDWRSAAGRLPRYGDVLDRLLDGDDVADAAALGADLVERAVGDDATRDTMIARAQAASTSLRLCVERRTVRSLPICLR